MQNKENTNGVDQAWEHMHELLDIHMPTEKRRRVPIWWWLGGVAALFVVGIVGYTKMNAVDSVNENKAYVVDNERIGIEKEQVASLNNSNKISANQDKNDLETTVNSVKNSSTKKPRFSTQNSISAPVKVSEVASLAPANQEQPNEEKQTETIAATATATDTDTAIDNIPCCELSTFLSNDSPNFAMKVEVVKPKKWSLALQAGGNFTLANGGFGTQAELTLSRQLQGRWSFSTGFGVAKWQLKEFNFGDSNDQSLSATADRQRLPDPNSTVDPTVSQDATLELFQYSSLSSTNSLEVPLQINYRFSPRWSGSLGIRGAYLFNMNLEDGTSLGTQLNYLRNAEVNFANLNTQPINRSEVLAQFGGWITAGTSFKLNQRLFINTQLLLGLNDWYLLEDENRYLHQVRLSVGYRF